MNAYADNPVDCPPTAARQLAQRLADLPLVYPELNARPLLDLLAQVEGEARPKPAPMTIGHGGFGLGGTRLAVDPGARPDELLFDVLCLLQNALAVFDAIADGGGPLHELHFAGLYLLRQAFIVCEAAQLTPEQGRASLAAAVPDPAACLAKAANTSGGTP